MLSGQPEPKCQMFYWLSSMTLLCNVLNGSNIDNDKMQSLNGMNDSYIFSLLPCILVLSNTNIT